MNETANKTPQQLQAQCMAWNALNPKGSMVTYSPASGADQAHRGKALGEAFILSGRTAVIVLEGRSMPVSLDHCVPTAQDSNDIKFASHHALKKRWLVPAGFDRMQVGDSVRLEVGGDLVVPVTGIEDGPDGSVIAVLSLPSGGTIEAVQRSPMPSAQVMHA